MRIALLVPEMEVGGVEQGTADLARGLRARGHDVWILCDGGRMLAPLVREGIRWIRVPLASKMPHDILFSIVKIRSFCVRVRPHILHARSRVPAWAAYLASRHLRGVHFITGFHSFYNRHWPSRIMGRGERVIAVSNAVAREAVAYFGAATRVRVVYNGVVPPAVSCRSADDTVTLGTLGRLTEGKGFETFISVVAEVAKRTTRKVRGLIGVGMSSTESHRQKTEQLAAAIKRFGCEGRIELVLTPDRAAFFSRVDIYVAAVSVPEGFGRTVVEAQMCGLPVVGSNIGAFPEIIKTGETGFLVPPAQDDFVECLLRLVEDDTLRRAMGERAREWSRARFTVDQMVEQTIAVYSEVTEDVPK